MTYNLSKDCKTITISGEVPNLWGFYKIALEIRNNEPIRRFTRQSDGQQFDALLFTGGIIFEGIADAPASIGQGYLIYPVGGEGDLDAIQFVSFNTDYILDK